MNKLALSAAVAAGTLVFAASANAQYNIPTRAGVSVGIYIPRDAETRAALGDNIMRFGFGNVRAQRTGNLKIGTEFDIISASRGGNRLMMIPVTIMAEQQLPMGESSGFTPYVRGFAGAAYIDYSIVASDGNRHASRVIRPTYGAEAGVVLTDRVRLSARYNIFPRTGGFDFSGTQLSATISVGF
jgi:hypothetical protein